MKKLILICAVAAYAPPAFAICTVSGGGLASCAANTDDCQNGYCKTTYSYKAAGEAVCECTDCCQNETFPSGYDASKCHCPFSVNGKAC